MKGLSVIWIALISLPAFGQLRKVESSYKKGNYADCIGYCQEAKRGADKEEYLTIKIYQCRANLNLFQKTGSKFNYLDQALLLHRNEKFSITPAASEVSNSLFSILKTKTDSLHKAGNKVLSKKYVKVQATQFKDTAGFYAFYYPPVSKPAAVGRVVKKEPAKRVSEPNRISRTELLKYSEQFLTIPYKWAGEDSSGFDCSGLVTKVFRHFGYTVAHGAKDQSELGEAVSRNTLKPGDLVFFGKRYDTGRCKIDHVAFVYEVTDTKLVVIHSSSKGVNIQELKTDDYWGKKILFYKNYIDHITLPEINRL